MNSFEGAFANQDVLRKLCIPAGVLIVAIAVNSWIVLVAGIFFAVLGNIDSIFRSDKFWVGNRRKFALILLIPTLLITHYWIDDPLSSDKDHIRLLGVLLGYLLIAGVIAGPNLSSKNQVDKRNSE